MAFQLDTSLQGYSFLTGWVFSWVSHGTDLSHQNPWDTHGSILSHYS